MSSHASLGAAADERKARLAKLKSLKRKQPPTEEDEDTPSSLTISQDPELPAAPDVAKLHLSGRNYDPEAKGPKLGFEAPPTLGLEKPTLEQQAADIEEGIRRKEEEERQKDGGEEGVDLFKLQPKKPNWDLKRDLREKMKVLDVRTENAIARIVRERVEAKQRAARLKAGSGEGKGEEGVVLVQEIKMRELEEREEEKREREDEELQ